MNEQKAERVEKQYMFFIDVENPEKTGAVEVECELATYYRMLNCQYIDITRRKVCGKYYDFIVDDMGLYNEDYKVSVFGAEKEQMLVGNVLICNHDGAGNESSLTPLDMLNIARSMMSVTDTATGESWQCLVGAEY